MVGKKNRSQAVAATGRKKMAASKSKTLILLTMVLPGTIWFFLLRYLPMAGIILAFKDYKVYPKNPTFWNNLMHSKWVGLQNFKFLFATNDSLIYIRNTIGYNALWIALGLVVSVAFAIILNEITQKFVAKTYQTLMFFPYFLSWVVASYFVLAFLDPTRGLLTHWMSTHGMTTIQWYSEPKYWPYILTICNVWKNTGYSAILYLAAITGIDASQYEAASIDGATKWQQIRYVTLPHLRPMISILLIMNVGKIFNSDFGLFYTVPLNSGSLYSANDVRSAKQLTGEYLIGTQSYSLGYELQASQERNIEVKMVPCTEPYVDTTSSQGAMMAISTASKNPERAMMFLNLLNTDPTLMTLLNYGVEGVHYDLTDDGLVKFTEKRNDYQPWTNGVGNVTILPPTEAQGAGFWDTFKDYYGNAKEIPILGFAYDPTNCETQMGSCANVVAEYMLPLCTGAVNPDEKLPEFLDKLEKAGVNDVIDDANAQLESFMAEKNK